MNENCRKQELLLSIIVPVYNGEDYLDACIESVANQDTNYSYEVILVDDGSKDKSLELCEKYSKRYDCIKVLHQENSGVSSARNRGIEFAAGKWITFVDCDDEIESDYVQTIGDNLDNTDLVAFGYDVIYFDGNIHHADLNDVSEPIKCGRTDILRIFGCDGLLSVAVSKVFRRDVIIQNELRYDIFMSTGEDLHFNCRYLGLIHRATFLPYNGYKYIRRETVSGVSSYKYNMLDIIQKDLDVLNQLYYDYEMMESVDRCNIIWDTLLSAVINLYRNECTYSKKRKLEEISAIINCFEPYVLENNTRNDVISKALKRGMGKRNPVESIYYRFEFMFWLKNSFRGIYMKVRYKYILR